MPTGYSFNLDGAAIYLSLAALYIAQATNTDLTIGQQLGLLAVMLLTSKGAAGVAGGGFIALTATLSTIGHHPGGRHHADLRHRQVHVRVPRTGQLHRQRGRHPVRRQVEQRTRRRPGPRVFAGKDVEPLLDPSEDLDVNPYDPDVTRTRPRQPRPAGHGRCACADGNRRVRITEHQRVSRIPVTPWTAGHRHHEMRSPGESADNAAHRAITAIPTVTGEGIPMRVLIAPDKFKGSLTAAEVADHLAKGLAEAGAHSRILPLADGGDGSVAAALAAGFYPLPVSVHGATGENHRGVVAFNADTAVVEVANTCGLATLPGGVRAPMTASSYGFGQAIRAASAVPPPPGARPRRQRQHRRRHRNAGRAGIPLSRRAGELTGADRENLDHIHFIDSRHVVDLSGIEVVVAGDVTSPLLGPTGAAAVFGPQKGATATQSRALDAGLENLVDAFTRSGV